MKKLIQTIFLKYICVLARLQLAKIKPKIIGVTGSEGKTSTTYAIKLALESKYKVKRSEKANSETGIPLDILGLEVKSYTTGSWLKLFILAFWKILTNWERYDVYIAEMGIDSPFEPKNMGYLLKILTPDIGVLTSISSVHGSFFEPLLTEDQRKLEYAEKIKLLRYEIVKEKGRLIDAAIKKNGFGIVNIDNEFIERFVNEKNFDVRTVTSKDHDTHMFVQIKSVGNSNDGFKAEYKFVNEELELNIKDTILGEEFAYTFGFALQAADIMGIDAQTAIKGLSSFEAPAGRFRFLDGIKNSKILDSSYNSTPVSLAHALKLFDKLESKGRKILVLGEMRELGDIAEEEHTRLAKIAVTLNPDQYLLLGQSMTTFFKAELERQGVALEKIHCFKHALEVGEFLKANMQENDLLLVKGSQHTIFLEEAIKKVLKDTNLGPLDASPLLSRQSAWWLKKKNKYFNSL